MRTFFVLLFILILTPNVFGASCNLPEAKARFDGLPQSEKKLLTQSCRETYTSGVGWTNSATGCGRCPSFSYSTTSLSSPLCQQNPGACAQVEALGQMQSALVSLGQNMAANAKSKAIEKIASKRLYFLRDASYPDTDLYEETLWNFPKEEEEFSVAKGEAVVTTSSGYFSECVVPLFDFEKKSIGGWKLIIIANQPLCKFREKDKVYHGTYFNNIKTATGSGEFSYPYKIKEQKKGIKICQRAMGMSGGCAKKRKVDEFLYGKGFVADLSQPTKELKYLGGDSQTVFLELASSTTRRFLISLTDSDRFACGGFSMKVIEADGIALTYVLEKGNLNNMAIECSEEIDGEFVLPLAQNKDPIETMRKLKEMLDLELITVEEYDEKRRKILDNM